MSKMTLGAAFLGLLFIMGACGEEEHHADFTMDITVTPDPAAVGSAAKIEVEVTEGTEHVLPEEVHISINLVGDTNVTEVPAMAMAEHFMINHTFTVDGTYDISAEAHMGGDHADPVEHAIQLVVNP